MLHNSSSPRDKEPTELDTLRKWQEERRARRLRGEYESAVLHLSQVINDNIHTPMNISAVRIEGAKNTRSSFLASIVAPAVQRSGDDTEDVPHTLEHVLHTTRHLAAALKKTDIFTSVEVYLDRPRDTTAASGDVDLVFKTRERGRWYLSSSTELGNSEGSASAHARIRNVFGGAETFEAAASLGTQTRRSFRGTLTTPLSASMTAFAELSAYVQDRDLSSYASCTEALRGARAVVRTGTPRTGAHEVAYDAVIRHITALTPTASFSTRQSAGTSLKSALSHTLLYDTRSDPLGLASTSGLYLKLTHELAGGAVLGGDAHHYKVEGEAQVSRRIGDSGVSVSLSAKSGIIYSLAPNGRTLFSDRFQLGGPTSVRSFRANGMGPRDGADSTGGEIFYSLGASLISDIPTKPNWPVKAHLWLNAGRLDNLNRDGSTNSNAGTEGERAPVIPPTFLSTPSISMGLGLIYRFDPVRVEVNFGLPLALSKGEAARRGLGVGVGLEFL
ncbi:SAM50-like protein SPAC17C9.06 [Psilocybe cubensis]|uniref:SAM50-like protein SPAC17C9.06 n=2 Tax=Psilocybe cubensis TaxID=181762 RepID=A0ACB8GQT9_PSICU|nr:SAM50-like protein SPAC17C9.06 [Psilocybe cubensis]KAH9477732.1 SAM50-like protein SPAC17C9.06 [Psilocybe cubensis]